MGYYSMFNLTLKDCSAEQRDSIVKMLEKLKVIGNALNENLECHINTKWYSYDNDLCFVSSHFPGVLFILNREGEEIGDHEISYYKNGMRQKCMGRIVYDDFDESQLDKVDFSKVEAKFKGLV